MQLSLQYMKLHKILKSNTGFTLIEIVVVVGIVLCVSAMTLVFDIRSLVFASVDEEVDQAVAQDTRLLDLASLVEGDECDV